jgi:hypothetical protein
VKKYRVTLPVEIDGKVYSFGEIVELGLEEAALYAHALIAVEESDGGDS